MCQLILTISPQHQTSTALSRTCERNRATPALFRSLVRPPTSTPKPRTEGRVRAGGTLLRRSRLPPRSVLGAPHRGAAPEAAGETKSFCPCHLKFGLIPGFPGFKPFSLLYENHYYGIIAAKNARKTAKNRKIQHEIQHGLHTKTTRFYAGFGCPLSKRQLQQRSRQKGTATQERWLFPFSCKRRVTAKKDGEKTPREANPHWAP